MTPWQVHVQPPRQGSSHAKSGVPCQDAAWTEKTEFAVTAALCDGLGSLEYSQIAARAAAKVRRNEKRLAKKQKKSLPTPRRMLYNSNVSK